MESIFAFSTHRNPDPSETEMLLLDCKYRSGFTRFGMLEIGQRKSY